MKASFSGFFVFGRTFIRRDGAPEDKTQRGSGCSGAVNVGQRSERKRAVTAVEAEQ